jgi:amino acid transporter
MTMAVAIAAASIARGAVHYLAVLFPFSSPILTMALVAGFTGIAALGVRESVGLAAATGVVEIAGLLVAIAAGLLAAPEFHMAGMFPTDVAGWRGAFAGAFIAFFAFIGFETLANLAEEVQDPKQTVPRGILGAVGASIVLYVAVATAAVLADSTSSSPLLDLFEGTNASVFAAVASIAVANGVLVEIVMLARLFYGMARNSELPAVLGRINPRTRTPTVATMLAGTIVLAAALLVPFERLLVLTNALTLVVFVLIDLALWRVQSREPATVETFMLPHWVPPLAALLAMGLMLAEVLV